MKTWATVQLTILRGTDFQILINIWYIGFPISYNINIVVHTCLGCQAMGKFSTLSKASLLDCWKFSRNWLELQIESDIWDFPTKLQHFGEMAITSLLRYFGEISEISTHYNDITILKFRGNIRNLPVSIEVLQTCLKISDNSPKYYKLLLTYFSTSFKNIGENLTIFSFLCIIFRRCMFILGVLFFGILKKLKKTLLLWNFITF